MGVSFGGVINEIELSANLTSGIFILARRKKQKDFRKLQQLARKFSVGSAGSI
jgi:hypothetical protein